MVDAKNVSRLADTIEAAMACEKPALGFNMNNWFGIAEDMSGHNCGTTACIAGWARALRIAERRSMDLGRAAQAGREEMLQHSFDWRQEQMWMDISGEQAATLFVGRENATPAHAVATLRRLAETGTVSWDEWEDDFYGK